MKITDKIYESLANWGDHPAFIELNPEGKPNYLSASEFRLRINELKRLFAAAGIRKNHIATMFLNNSADFAAALLALIDIGAKPVPVNMAFRKMELDEIFLNANPNVIIAESHHAHIIRPYTDGRAVIERRPGKWRVDNQGGKADSLKSADIDDFIASINYTYRGHGYPLGALVPHSQLIHGAKVLVDALKPESGMNMLVVLPFSYIFPLVVCLCVPLIYKLTSTISSTVNPLHLFDFIQKYNINIITAVPEIYELIYGFKDHPADLSTLTDFMCGGSYISDELFTKVTEAFPHVVVGQGYGLTEFTPVCRHIRHEARVGTIGPLSDGVECRLSSQDATGAGEITLRCPFMTKSYYRRPVETAEAFQDGWFKTGDIGRFNNGHLVFVKEKKGTRKVKGNMVDLEESRKALLSCPGICEAAVEYRNNLLKARIGIDHCNDFDSAVLETKEILQNKIARYKIPKEMIEI
jgi:fatty-acyl-CoA synthase